MAAGIGDIHSEAGGQLLLHIEVPLLHIPLMLASNEHRQALADQSVRPLRGVDERDEPVRERVAKTIARCDAAIERADERRANRSDRIVGRSPRAFKASWQPEDSVAAANH